MRIQHNIPAMSAYRNYTNNISAISEITTSEYAPKSASNAFESTFITNRPEAAISQTCASFVVSLDDYKITGAGTGDVFTLDVGRTTISFALTQGGQDIDDVIAHSTGDIPDATDGDTTADATTSNMTSDFTGKTEWTTAANTGAYVETDGYILQIILSPHAAGKPCSEPAWLISAGQKYFTAPMNPFFAHDI